MVRAQGGFRSTKVDFRYLNHILNIGFLPYLEYWNIGVLEHWALVSGLFGHGSERY